MEVLLGQVEQLSDALEPVPEEVLDWLMSSGPPDPSWFLLLLLLFLLPIFHLLLLSLLLHLLLFFPHLHLLSLLLLLRLLRHFLLLLISLLLLHIRLLVVLLLRGRRWAAAVFRRMRRASSECRILFHQKINATSRVLGTSSSIQRSRQEVGGASTSIKTSFCCFFVFLFQPRRR